MAPFSATAAPSKVAPSSVARRLLLSSLLAWGGGACAADASSDALLRSARANFTALNTMAAQGQLTVQRRSCGSRAPEITLMTDRNIMARRHTVAIRSDAGALSVQQDYDAAGILTFVLAQFTPVRGLKTEWRLYFSASGRLVERLRTGAAPQLEEHVLWRYITRDPLTDWNNKWCG